MEHDRRVYRDKKRKTVETLFHLVFLSFSFCASLSLLNLFLIRVQLNKLSFFRLDIQSCFQRSSNRKKPLWYAVLDIDTDTSVQIVSGQRCNNYIVARQIQYTHVHNKYTDCYSYTTQTDSRYTIVTDTDTDTYSVSV